MKKSIATQLRRLAQEMPLLKTYQKRRATGKELLEAGYVSRPDMTIEDHIDYVASMPKVHNHYEALKQAYKAEGKDGIRKYMEMVNRIVREQKEQQALEAAKPKDLDENFESVDGRVQRKLPTIENVPETQDETLKTD